MARARERRIVSGPLGWEIGRFGVPLALGMALQTTFNLIDAYLIAKLPIEEVGAAVGAIGICDQVAALGTIVSYGVSTATATIISQRKGAGDSVGIQQTAWQSMLIVLALSVVLGLLGGFGSGFFVRDLIGAKGDVAKMATSYLRIMTAGSFSIFFLLQLTNMQRALGSSKTPVALLAAGNVLNVVLAVVLIFGQGPAPSGLRWGAPIAAVFHLPRMGMLGAAWATIIARSAALIPITLLLIKRFNVFPPKGLRSPKPETLGRIVSLAWPSSGQFFLRIAAMLLINSLVARFFTTATDQTATIALGLVFRLDTMALFVAMGWGAAAQTFVGQNLGAGRPDRARRSGWITTAYDAVTNILLFAVIVRYGEAILRVFDDETAPVTIALQYLHIVAPTYVALGVGIVLGHAMAGAGATRTTLAADAFVIFAIQVPLCAFAVFLGGGAVRWVFYVVAITNIASSLVYCVLYARSRWLLAQARIGHSKVEGSLWP